MDDAFYYDDINNRWQGSKVPGECDYIGCYDEIDRGMGFECSDACGCGLYFCYEHQGFRHDRNSTEAKPDSIEWLERILTDEQWEEFRRDHPMTTLRYRETVDDY